MPVRSTAVPVDASIAMYRSFDFGSLARLHVLDTRQFRSDQASSVNSAEDTSRHMLGSAQKSWLVDGVQQSAAQWNLIGSQIMFSETDLQVGSGKLWYYDSWDGYQSERNNLLDQFQSARNLVVLSGDRHRTVVSDVRLDFADPESKVIGAEFVGTSISTWGDEDLAAFAATWTPIAAENPSWKLIDAHRGYLLLDVTSTAIDAQLRVMDTVLTRNGTASTLARFRVDSDTPGVNLV
jgi:alkaline phosphatase D